LIRQLTALALVSTLTACASAGGLGFLGGGYSVPSGTERARYDVRGDTFDEVRGELSSKGRHGFHGWTEWQVRWDYRTYGDAGRGCEVAGFSTDLSIRITTPRLAGAHTKQTALREEWLRYERALRHHEEGHAAIAAEAACEMERRVDALAETTGSCAGLGTRIDQVCHRVLVEYRRRDREYERETGHGRTQGAIFGLSP